VFYALGLSDLFKAMILPSRSTVEAGAGIRKRRGKETLTKLADQSEDRKVGFKVCRPSSVVVVVVVCTY
jgi:hypothetical protein